MKKKSLIQIFLIIILFFITYSIVKKYYIKDKSLNLSEKIEIENSQEEEKLNSSSIGKNVIKDIKYSSNSKNGNIYEIYADYGESDIENPELMFLNKVTGKIIIQNKNDIILTSDFANFNTKTFETTFINNVEIIKGEEIITGDELYLVLDRDQIEIQKNPSLYENLIRITRNVVYKKPGYTLEADILEIDLITKNIKIYMLDDLKKVNAKSKIK